MPLQAFTEFEFKIKYRPFTHGNSLRSKVFQFLATYRGASTKQLFNWYYVTHIREGELPENKKNILREYRKQYFNILRKQYSHIFPMTPIYPTKKSIKIEYMKNVDEVTKTLKFRKRESIF